MRPTPGTTALVAAAVLVPIGLGTIVAANDNSKWSALGAELLGGAVVALAIFLLERHHQEQEGRRRSAMADLDKKRRADEARFARTQHYLNQFHDPVFSRLRLQTKSFFEHCTASPEARNEAVVLLYEDLDLRTAVSVTLNFWEHLGKMYNAKQIERNVVEEMFRGPAVAEFREAEWFISRRREEQGDADLWIEWETMIDGFGPNGATPRDLHVAYART